MGIHGTQRSALNAQPHWAWLPPDFPPTTLDPVESTSPMVSGEVRHFRGPMPHAVRPTHAGVVDLITGSHLLREVDFELPFGSSVFRHIRTYSDSWRDNRPCTITDMEGEHLWDWNGAGWMASENPLFLFDANRYYNVNEPPKCYFIPDAHHAIPFTLDVTNPSEPKYVAPPWFDASLSFEGGQWNSADKTWTSPPTTFTLHMHRRSLTYTIELLNRPMFPVEMREPETCGGCSAGDGGIAARGLPLFGLVTLISDRYGNVAEFDYCTGDSTGTCRYKDPTSGTDQECFTPCNNCNEVGQLQSVRLKRTNSADQLETVWTLLYTHRGFGYYCDRCGGACPPGLPCPLSDPENPEPECPPISPYEFDLGATRNLQHAIHTIHVYEGDVSVPGSCLSLDFMPFCAAETYDHADAVNHPDIPSNWVLEARYYYAEAHLRSDQFSCPSECLYYGAGEYSYPFNQESQGNKNKLNGMELLKTTITRKTTAAESKEHTIYRYRAEGISYCSNDYVSSPVSIGVAILDHGTIQSILSAEREVAPEASVDVNWLVNIPRDEHVHRKVPETNELEATKFSSLFSAEFHSGSHAPIACLTDGSYPSIAIPAEIDGLVNWYSGDSQRTLFIRGERVFVDRRKETDRPGTFAIYHLLEYPAGGDPNPGTCDDELESIFYVEDRSALVSLYHSSIEEIKYPYRYQTIGSHGCGDPAEFYRRLMGTVC